MAIGYYMNMEKIALDIANTHTRCMTNDNLWEATFVDTEKMKVNLKHGFIVITNLHVFIESFLNTILSSCMNYSGKSLLQCSVTEKIDIIFMHYEKDFSDIKSQKCWEVYSNTIRVRNEMIHYKKNYIATCSAMTTITFAKQSLEHFFTLNEMQKAIDNFIQLATLIANTLGLKLNQTVDIFEADGRDGLVNFVYDESMIEIDPSRYESAE